MNNFLNRELSWLDFNCRVLALAEDRGVPLLERVNFLAIFSRNLDEFFQIRVAGLKEQLGAGLASTAPDGLATAEVLDTIRVRVQDMVARQMRTFANDIVPSLRAEGIRLVDYDALSPEEVAYLDGFFEERLFPVLTPLAVDPAHPFPFISNLSLNLAAVVGDPASDEPRIARVKVPPLLPRFVAIPDSGAFVALEQIIASHLATLFPGMQVFSRHAFRVTRNTDFTLNEDDIEDLLVAVETALRLRRRSPRAVRLETDAAMPPDVRTLLLDELELESDDVYEIDGPLDLSGLAELIKLRRPDLKYEPWTPVTQTRLAPPEPGARTDIFRALRAGDILVHHPYDSFSTSVEAFIEQASMDPAVLAIKQTVYRTSTPASSIARSLMRAAESGKQVVAVVEVTARFDEETNIAWARALEEAGVHVVYGIVGLKTHAKCALVVRRDEDGIRRYSHVGTGNYNPITAALYEDVGLLSSDPESGSDLTDLFNFLTGYSKQSAYRKLLIAPVGMRTAILGLIRAEMEKREAGRITMKVNNLVDAEIINALYAASNAGVDVDLIVRSICCLQPGVPNVSERIRVRSIVGRYLEHSRIFRFGRDSREASYLIGSADLMPRNLDRRVEAAVPVTDPALQQRLSEVLDIELSDDCEAWHLTADGTWRFDGTGGARRQPQRVLQELALARSQAHVEAAG
ncbi:MAG TPA: polyphosphate kinase 1 [Candidatus Eremiobacteraceae bacterium]|nr:polyphosphate kinase 1 [Candidatus Eremiobacteraceae bacterium]